MDVNNRHKEILQKLVILLNVKPASVDDTAIFSELNQEELEDAFEYWFTQSTMVFGEVGKMERTHSLKEAGIDLCFNLINSKYKIGIQIKTFGDITDKYFSSKVLAQKSQSLKHKLSKYLLILCGDMNNDSHRQKIQGMSSEMLQQNDDYVIVISPQKALSIYKAYKENQHPLKFVFLEYSEVMELLNGIVDNLNDENRKVKISLSINDINQRVNENQNQNFTVKMHFDKNDKETKILDEIKNMKITDDVIKIDSNFHINRINNNITDNTSKAKLYAWVEKYNRGFFSIQSISHYGNIIETHNQVMDIEKNDNIVTFIPKDMNEPLKLTFNLDTNTFDWKFNIELNYIGYDVVTIYDKINFINSINNSSFLRIYSPELELIENIPIIKLPDFRVSLEICELIRILFNLSKETGNKIIIKDIGSSDEFNIEKILLQALRLLYIADTKLIIFTYDNPKVRVTLRKDIALKVLEDYRNNLFIGSSILKIDYSENFFDNNILILNSQLDLFQLKPNSELNDIKNIVKTEVEIELELKDEYKSKINKTN